MSHPQTTMTAVAAAATADQVAPSIMALVAAAISLDALIALTRSSVAVVAAEEGVVVRAAVSVVAGSSALAWDWPFNASAAPARRQAAVRSTVTPLRS